MYIGLHVEHRYSCQILMKLQFSGNIIEKNSISNFMRICLVAAELLNVDRQT